jgi:hypothetical protein
MRTATPYLAILAAATLLGCGAGSSGSAVSVSSAVKTGTSKLSSVPTASGTAKLENLYLVLKEIELKKAPPAPTGGSGATGSTGPTGSTQHDVEELEVGPYALELTINDTNLAPVQPFIPSTVVPPGSYGGIEFEIHRVRSTEKLNIQTTKGGTKLEGLSIVLEGTCALPATAPATGTTNVPFAVTSSMEVEVEYESPFEVVQDAQSNVTLAFDASTWLAGPNGTTLDPCANDPEVNARIMANVKSSLKAFEDDDCDGKEDHD